MPAERTDRERLEWLWKNMRMFPLQPGEVSINATLEDFLRRTDARMAEQEVEN